MSSSGNVPFLQTKILKLSVSENVKKKFLMWVGESHK